jgi:hypothetical protein
MAIVDDMGLTAAPETVYLVAVGRLYRDLNKVVPPVDRGRRPGVTDDAIATAVADLTARHGVPPTVRELGDALGLSSPSSVKFALDRARKAGLVTWVPGKVRTLRTVRVA